MDFLAAGANYPAVTLTVNVVSNAPSVVTNTATVTGGGDTSVGNNNVGDSTKIVPIGCESMPESAHPYSNCQYRLKIPHYSGRKFPSPHEVVVYSFGWQMVHRNQPVKRRRAMLESNPPRNSRLQTRQDDGSRGEAR